jgi:hypothetical protein
VCRFVLFLLATVLSVRLRFTDSDYPLISSSSSLSNLIYIHLRIFGRVINLHDPPRRRGSIETRNILLLVYLSIYCPLLWMIFWRIVNMNVYERIRPLDFVLFVVPFGFLLKFIIFTLSLNV